jgi:hypothetical protein
MALPMSNSELDIALRERWEQVYQNLHELVMLYNAYLPISATEMFLSDHTLPEGYTISADGSQVLDASGQPQAALTQALYRCNLRKSALAAARALQALLRNEGLQGLMGDHNFFVKQFVTWRYRFFG